MNVLHYAVQMRNRKTQHGSLLWNFVKRNIAARYKGTFFGICWSFLNPLALFCVYLLVFGFFLKVRMPGSVSFFDFALYFSAGFFPWVFFSGAVMRAAGSIIDNRNYIKKVAFPLEIFPLSVVLAESVSLCISIGIVIVFSIFAKGFTPFILLLPIVMIVQVFFTLALSMLCSAATVYVRDIPHILNSLFMIWFWLTPIAYTVDFIPEKFKILVYMNPLYYNLEFYRSILFSGTAPKAEIFFPFTVGVIALFLFSAKLFYKAKPYFADVL